MSHATEVAKAPDEMIQLAAHNDHADYYRIGQKITVTWMPGWRLYLCLTCRLNKCVHTDRVRKYREAHA